MSNNTLFIEQSYFLRQETSGITVYNKAKHRFSYMEGLTIDDVIRSLPVLSAKSFEDFMDKNPDRFTQNIHVEGPLYLGWQLSESCNMDCIYCFADDKLHTGNTADILDTSRSILALNPVCVGLSGGEPTLNKKLPDIIRLFSGKTAIVLNTNGTTPMLADLVPLLKEAHVHVRISIDSTVNEIQNYQRPLKANRSLDCNQLELIKNSVRLLKEAGIAFEIHTVVTTKDRDYLEQTGKDLVEMGVTRWHLYHLDKCPKCKDFYDELEVKGDELMKIYEGLKEKFKGKLEVTAAAAAVPRPKAILLVDSNGRFYVKDSGKGEIYYIGDDPFHPSVKDLHDVMNWEMHQKCYFTNLNPQI